MYFSRERKILKKDLVFSSNLAIIFFLLVIGSIRHTSCEQSNKLKSGWFLFIPGDIYLGGMFPIHTSPNSLNGECGKVRSGRGIQRLEGMIFALHMLNNHKDQLSNVSDILYRSKNKYGAVIFDTCDFDSYGVEAAIRMAMTKLVQKRRWAHNALKHVTQAVYTNDERILQNVHISAVIGAATSEVSVATSYVLRMAQIPQLSYSSTSSELSNKIRFNYFSRTVPADDMQATVMAQIISALKWTYIAVVKESGNYGERFAEDLKAAMKTTNACVATDKTIPFSDDEQRYTQVLEELNSEEDLQNVRVIVVFAQEDVVRKLLRYTTSMNLTNRWIWLSSDAWGYKIYPVNGYEEAALNAITIAPKKYKVTAFDSYFWELQPQGSTINPWFIEYWEEIFKCRVLKDPKDEILDTKVTSHYFSTFDTDREIKKPYHERACTGRERDEQNAEFSQESFVHFVIDAVFAAAIAIEKLIAIVCTNGQYCESFNSVPGLSIQNEIRNVSFTSMSGREVRFDKLGNGICSYDIFQYQYDEKVNEFTYKLIGSYKNIDGQYKLMLKFNKIVFWDKLGPYSDSHLLINQGDVDPLLLPSQSPNENNAFKANDQGLVGWSTLPNVPSSYCQQECEPGVVKVNTRNKCCWTCKHCPPHHIAMNGTTCVECAGELTANMNQTKCVQMEAQYVNIRDPLSILAMVLACTGLLANGLLVLVFIYYSSTPIIKASARELCYVLILGMTACYTMTFSLVSKPCTLVCTANRFGVSISLSICLSALLTKTNRISRIFNRNNRSLQKTSFVSPTSQLLICFAIVAVQISALLVWFALRPPKVNKVIDYFRDGKRLVLTCDFGNNMIAISLLYNMIMVVCCTIYAFKTRKIPENFNEAKYIGFTMYSVCLVWLAFIAIYFGVASSEHWFRIQVTTIAICLTLSAYVITGCLFVPKVYVVIFQPRKNVRQKSNIKRLIARNAMYDSMKIVQEDVIGTVLNLRQIECSEKDIPPSLNNVNPIHSIGLINDISRTTSCGGRTMTTFAADNFCLPSIQPNTCTMTHIENRKITENTQHLVSTSTNTTESMEGPSTSVQSHKSIKTLNGASSHEHKKDRSTDTSKELTDNNNNNNDDDDKDMCTCPIVFENLNLIT